MSRSWAFVTREADWVWQWKIQKQFHDLISRVPSATNHKLDFIYIFIFEYIGTTRHQKQGCLTSYGNFVHKLVLSVIVQVQSGSVLPAVLAASGSAVADGIVLTVIQAVQTKLNQDNFLLVCGEEGAGPYWTLTDNERWLRVTLESIQTLFSTFCFTVGLILKLIKVVFLAFTKKSIMKKQ